MSKRATMAEVRVKQFSGIYLCGHGWMSLEDGKQVLLKKIFEDKVREAREAKEKP